MTGLPLRADPRAAKLQAELQVLGDDLADFEQALFGVNDRDLIDAFRAPIQVGLDLVAFHCRRVTTTVADDTAHLRSLFGRHHIPREDPQLGPLDSLTRLRNARGALLADLDELLAAAKVMGLSPRDPSIAPPTAAEFERAGMFALLAGLERRLSQVDSALDALRPEASDTDPGGQQSQLVTFFVDNLAVEVALARLEIRAPVLVDFSSLTRAVEAMAELTRDFVSTVRAMREKLTRGLYVAAEGFRPLIRRVTRGLKTLVRVVHRSSARSDQLATPTAPDGSSRLSIQEEVSFLQQQADKCRAAWLTVENESSRQGLQDLAAHYELEARRLSLEIQSRRDHLETDPPGINPEEPWEHEGEAVDDGELLQTESPLHLLAQIFECPVGMAREILSQGTLSYFEPDKTIVRQGERLSRLIVFLSGRAHALMYSVEGQVILLSEYRKGDLFGAVGIDDPVPSEAEVVAVENVSTFEIEASAVTRLTEFHGAIGVALSRLLLNQLRKSTARIYERAAVSAVGRVNAEILRLARASPGLTIRPAPIVSELAIRVSTTRETASRAISTLERKGIIRRDSGSLTVIAPQRLEELIL